MEIVSDLQAVVRRIAEITGEEFRPAAAPPAAPFASLVEGTAAGRSGVDRASPAPEQIRRLVRLNAAAWNVDPALIEAIVANESGFDSNATSAAGAQGLMQLMPGTAAALGVADAYDPAQNLRGGTRYLKGLLDRFGGDVRLAVAAYNAGPGAIEKYRGIPPYAETQNYVANVLASYERYTSARPR